VIGPGCHLVDCEVGERVRISQSTGERAVVEDDVVVGAFSVLEPGTRLARGRRIGPFFGAGPSVEGIGRRLDERTE
jgi:bifunctional UDP-N-acetylglucosamine pyrophosphorylase/glucosamine-1-phosphate N-acetyltransferase